MRRPASRRGWSCGRGSAVCRPGWAPASPPAHSAAARPGSPCPQSRVTSSVGSVGKSKNSHDTVCLLIENYDQIAISCVGMADVNILVWLPAQQSRSYNKGIKDEIQSQCLHFFS